MTPDTIKAISKVAKKFPSTTCTDLVIWNESNIGSSLIMWVKRIPLYLAYIYELPFNLKCALFGIMLSDGHLEKLTNFVRFSIIQSIPAHFEYLWAVFELFKPFCNNYPAPNKVINGIIITVIVRTRGLPCFIPFYEIFYLNGIKVIPDNISLFTYLTPIGLAHLVIGDGAYYRGGGLLLCTDSFTLLDCCRLVNFLHIRYGWVCNIHTNKKGYNRIYIPKRYLGDVLTVVGPHMVPSMLYKLNA